MRYARSITVSARLKDELPMGMFERVTVGNTEVDLEHGLADLYVSGGFEDQLKE